jgi:rhodanese-related sulfurtransferase
MSLIDKRKTYYVHCATGYRSLVFISILKARGFDNLVDVKEGFERIKEIDKIKLSDYVCPTTEL